MTIEESLYELKIRSKVLENMILYNKDFEPKNDNTSLENEKNDINIGIKALEKQIPKKATDIRYFGEAGYYIGLCPCCKSGNNSEFQYCGDCGQAIDWSGENVN